MLKNAFTAVSRRAIIAGGAILVAVILSGTALDILLLRNEALKRAEENLTSLASVLAEQTARSIQSVDLVVSATVADFGSDHIRARLSGVALHERLRDRTAALQEVSGIAFLDHEGRVTNHSRQFPPPAANYADRDYFALHRDRAVDGLHIGVPVSGRLVPGWQQTFSRRVENSQGEFLGVVSAAIMLERLHPFYRSVRLGPGGRVTIFRGDGVLVNTFPFDERAIGRSYAANPLFADAPGKSGARLLSQDGIVDEEPRLIAYQRLRDYPVVVAVSSTELHVLADWRDGAVTLGVLAGGASLLIGLGVGVALRQQRLAAGLTHDLLEAGQRLSGIVHSAMDAIITIDKAQRIVLFNEAAEEVFGCPAGEAVGSTLDRFIPERFRAVHRRHVEEFGRTGTTARRMGTRLELFGLRVNGEEFPIDASISQIAADGKKFFTVILRDVTRRKRAEAALERSYHELRELSATMNEVREAERTRIARELHDELAQWLTALKMDVSWLASRLSREHAPLLERTEKMKGVVDTTVAAVRRIAADLRPVMLDDLGLVPAIEGLLHDLSQRTGIVVSLEPDYGSLAPGEPVATSLYRMVQEALTNVARHAEATEVRVTMSYEGEMLVVRVRDNGKGYDDGIAAQKKSYGVLGIRERAYTLGGSARIARAAGGGTLVEIEIPMTRFQGRGQRGDTRTAG